MLYFFLAESTGLLAPNTASNVANIWHVAVPVAGGARSIHDVLTTAVLSCNIVPSV